jgi:hypothetical protein
MRYRRDWGSIPSPSQLASYASVPAMTLPRRMNQLYRLIDAAPSPAQPWHEDIFLLGRESVESHPKETFIESGNRRDRRQLYGLRQYW